MKRFLVFGTVIIIGAAIGCSGNSGVAEGQPKNADPNAKSKVSRVGANPGGAPAKAAGAIKD